MATANGDCSPGPRVSSVYIPYVVDAVRCVPPAGGEAILLLPAEMSIGRALDVIERMELAAPQGTRLHKVA